MHHTLPPGSDKSPTSFPRPHLLQTQPPAHHTRRPKPSTRCALDEQLAVRLGISQPVDQFTVELLGVFLMREVADAVEQPPAVWRRDVAARSLREVRREVAVRGPMHLEHRRTHRCLESADGSGRRRGGPSIARTSGGTPPHSRRCFPTRKRGGRSATSEGLATQGPPTRAALRRRGSSWRRSRCVLAPRAPAWPRAGA